MENCIILVRPLLDLREFDILLNVEVKPEISLCVVEAPLVPLCNSLCNFQE